MMKHANQKENANGFRDPHQAPKKAEAAKPLRYKLTVWRKIPRDREGPYLELLRSSIPNSASWSRSL